MVKHSFESRPLLAVRNIKARHVYLGRGGEIQSPFVGGAGSGEDGVEYGLGEAAGLGVLLPGEPEYTADIEVATVTMHKPKRVWSVADAQANLEEVLRLSETEGPQYIDAGKEVRRSARGR